MEKRTRYLAVGVSFVLIVMFLFSLSYMVRESDHECTGDNCDICMHICECLHMLKRIAPPLFSTIVLPPRGTALVVALGEAIGCLRRQTPVGLKVKLSC